MQKKESIREAGCLWSLDMESCMANGYASPLAVCSKNQFRKSASNCVDSFLRESADNCRSKG